MTRVGSQRHRKRNGRAGQATDDNTIRRMRFAWWIKHARAHTHRTYKLMAFPRQPSLRERASMLRCTYLVLLVYDIISTVFRCFFTHCYVNCITFMVMYRVYRCCNVLVICASLPHVLPTTTIPMCV